MSGLKSDLHLMTKLGDIATESTAGGSSLGEDSYHLAQARTTHLARLLNMTMASSSSMCSRLPGGGRGEVIRPTPKKPYPSSSDLFQGDSIKALSKTWEYILHLRQQQQQPFLEQHFLASGNDLKGQFSPSWFPTSTPTALPFTLPLPLLPPPPPSVKRMPVVVLSREKDNKSDNSDEDDEEIIVGTENENNVAQETALEASAANMATSSRLEVAACDGPVKFRRVANPFTTKVPTDEPIGGPSSQGGTSDVTYQCLFCNHIFKSHYCYQKHKRRHLNPFLADFHKVKSVEKKSLILQDINVQFFPCKICGAKFPSYYFVHKHKKLWHEGEEEPTEAETKAKVIKEEEEEKKVSPATH